MDFGAVGGHGDGLCAGLEVGEGVEGFAGFVAGGLLPGGDVDFRGAGLEEAGLVMLVIEHQYRSD